MNKMLTRTLAFLMVAVALVACGDDEETTCGNGQIDSGEQCEVINGAATFLNNATCETATAGQMPGGQLGCVPSTCGFDLSKCTGPGNGGGGGTGG